MPGEKHDVVSWAKPGGRQDVSGSTMYTTDEKTPLQSAGGVKVIVSGFKGKEVMVTGM